MELGSFLRLPNTNSGKVFLYGTIPDRFSFMSRVRSWYGLNVLGGGEGSAENKKIILKIKTWFSFIRALRLIYFFPIFINYFNLILVEFEHMLAWSSWLDFRNGTTE